MMEQSRPSDINKPFSTHSNIHHSILLIENFPHSFLHIFSLNYLNFVGVLIVNFLNFKIFNIIIIPFPCTT